MAHSLDLKRLGEIFEGLKENAHKLTTWEIDRLEEWEAKWNQNPGQRMFTDPDSKVMEILEQMWAKV